MNETLKGTETKPIALYKLFIVLCNSFFLHTLYIKEKKKGGGVFIRSTRKKSSWSQWPHHFLKLCTPLHRIS